MKNILFDPDTEYWSREPKSIEELIELKQTREIYNFNYIENWVLSCYFSFIKRSEDVNTFEEYLKLEKWFMGCLKKYNKDKEEFIDI